MLDKIKAIPFIDESSALKVTSIDGKIVLERTDKVIWAQEKTTIENEGISCYVDAKQFFALYSEIKELKQGTCLKVELKNGAVYELPFMDVSWETVKMPTEYHDTLLFKIEDLMLTTLRNLIKPELQCIYFDKDGAVSCDIISACISNKVKSSYPFLLPLDVQELVVNKSAKVNANTDMLYIQGENFSIALVKPEITDEWFNDLRNMISEDIEYVPVKALDESLKRLAIFGDYVSFHNDLVLATGEGQHFEPFEFKDLGQNSYELEKVIKLLSVTSFIGECNNNLILKNEGSRFLISSMEEA